MPWRTRKGGVGVTGTDEAERFKINDNTCVIFFTRKCFIRCHFILLFSGYILRVHLFNQTLVLEGRDLKAPQFGLCVW